MRYIPTVALRCSQSSGKADQDESSVAFALMPQHSVGPILDTGVWMERRVEDGSSGPR